jgi:hypothetical protein
MVITGTSFEHAPSLSARSKRVGGHRFISPIRPKAHAARLEFANLLGYVLWWQKYSRSLEHLNEKVYNAYNDCFEGGGEIYHATISHHPRLLWLLWVLGVQCSLQQHICMLEDNPCSKRIIRRGFIEMTSDSLRFSGMAENVLFTMLPHIMRISSIAFA